MNKKQIVYKDKPRTVTLLVISWTLTIASLFAGFLPGFFFFAICAAVATYPFIHPSKKVIFFNSKEHIAQSKTEFDEKLKDAGIFTYTGEGFSINIQDKETFVSWSEIQAVFGYKVNQYIVDEIRADIFVRDGHSFTVSEETPGWYIFLDKIAAQFPVINKSWALNIMVPAFEKSLTLVYERQGRSVEEATRYYYRQV